MKIREQLDTIKQELIELNQSGMHLEEIKYEIEEIYEIQASEFELKNWFYDKTPEIVNNKTVYERLDEIKDDLLIMNDCMIGSKDILNIILKKYKIKLSDGYLRQWFKKRHNKYINTRDSKLDDLWEIEEEAYHYLYETGLTLKEISEILEKRYNTYFSEDLLNTWKYEYEFSK